MAGYHAVLVHFPIALLMTATLAILLRAVSDGPLAKATDRALVPLLAIGLLTGGVPMGSAFWCGRGRRSRRRRSGATMSC